MTLRLEHVSSSTVRETIALGRLPEVEHGLLNRHCETLNMSTKDKAMLLDMSLDVYLAKTHLSEIQVQVRSLCHSRGVTADHLTSQERFNLKKCILVLGEVGVVPAAWAELVQPAVQMYCQDFNIIWIEIPPFGSDASRYLKHGPAILQTVLKELRVESVSVMACGVG